MQKTFNVSLLICIHLQVPVYQPVHLEVIVILSEGIYQNLGDLEPAHVEEELQEGEDGNVEIHLMTLEPLAGVQELSAHQRGHEEGVHREGHDLVWTNQR